MPGETEFGQFFVTLGVGGVLAAFMFVFYRKDVKLYTSLWKTSTDLLINVIKENTAVLTKLLATIESVERNSMRKADIELLIEQRIKKDV